MMTYCSEAGKYSDEQGTLLSNFWSDVDYTEGRGVNGQRYAQRMFHYPKKKISFRFNSLHVNSYGMYQRRDVG